jgi:putative ABC transport system permease protein
VAAFDAAVRAVPGVEELRRVPTLRGRIVAIAGVPVEQATIDPDSQWAVRGDRAFTYSATMPEGTRLVAGDWWPADYAGPPLVSIDASLARGFGVGIGDTLTLSILGREIEATIDSLREIDWRSLRFDFAIIFSPGVLEGAPHTHIAAAQVRPEAEEAVERAGTDAFPNVSAIRVREALEAAARILDATSVAIRSTAGISIVSGVLVLAGAIAAGSRRRIYDSVVFKVLGATRRTMTVAFLAEYGTLGLLTGLIAAAVGTLTAWAVIVHLMRAEWFFLPEVVAVTVAASIAVTVAVGFAGTWRALGQKAAFYLRNE